MSIIIYDKPAYSMEEYKKIRLHNREICKLDPEFYGSRQNDFCASYEMKVDGTAYVFDNWNKGISYLRKHFKAKLTQYGSFKYVFLLGKRLPENIEYVKSLSESEFVTSTYYVSRECKFETHHSNDNFKIIPYYGKHEDIRSIILDV